jgi:dolichol-phosphate mannosyltransferase
MKLSIVLPVHNEEEVLDQVLARVREAAGSLPHEIEVIVVDDGSTDGSWEIISGFADAGEVRGVRLSRNFGHQVALTAGLYAATGDAVITMDSDLQHPPELIPALVAKADAGHDVVYAVRAVDDAEGWLKVQSARAFYWVFNKLSSLDLPGGGADYRYMSRRVVDGLLQMNERARFLRGMTRWVGYSQTVIEYSRSAREAGKPKYTIRHMVRLATDAIVSFSATPLRVASIFGFLVAAAGGVYLLYVVALKLFTDRSVAGWSSVIISVLIIGGAQLMFMGVIGQYLSRIFDEAKGRPLFLVDVDTAARDGDTDQMVAWPRERA